MTRQEVDDVLKTLNQTPVVGLLSARPRFVAVPHTAPDSAFQGTGLSSAGTSAAAFVAEAAVIGVRSTDLPGTPARGAPV